MECDLFSLVALLSDFEKDRDGCRKIPGQPACTENTNPSIVDYEIYVVEEKPACPDLLQCMDHFL